MKTPILAIILTFACIVSSYSQMNQKRKRDLPANNSFRFDQDIKPALGYEKTIKPNAFWFNNKTEGFLEKNKQYTSAPGNTVVLDSMPCYKPDGVFSMTIIKPDSTIRYTMPLRRY